MKRGEQVWCRVTYGVVAAAAGCCVSEVRRLVRSRRLDIRDLVSVSRFVVSRTLSPGTVRAGLRVVPDTMSGSVEVQDAST